MEKIDMELLPKEAKKELIDFYKALLRKYRAKKRSIEDLEKEILADQIQIDTKDWKFNREEIYGR